MSKRVQIERQPVKSGAIASLGYDPESRKLHVEFPTTGVYEYDDVSPEKFDALVNAESIGRHFMANIRHDHEFRKL